MGLFFFYYMEWKRTSDWLLLAPNAWEGGRRERDRSYQMALKQTGPSSVRDNCLLPFVIILFPVSRWYFLLGTWWGGILVHFPTSQERNKERSFSISESHKTRSWAKTHYTWSEAGYFLLMGRPRLKKSSGSAGQVGSIFSPVGIAPPLLWVISSGHTLRFLLLL